MFHAEGIVQFVRKINFLPLWARQRILKIACVGPVSQCALCLCASQWAMSIASLYKQSKWHCNDVEVNGHHIALHANGQCVLAVEMNGSFLYKYWVGTAYIDRDMSKGATSLEMWHCIVLLVASQWALNPCGNEWVLHSCTGQWVLRTHSCLDLSMGITSIRTSYTRTN